MSYPVYKWGQWDNWDEWMLLWAIKIIERNLKNNSKNIAHESNLLFEQQKRAERIAVRLQRHEHLFTMLEVNYG